jgi:hypothetical protein
MNNDPEAHAGAHLWQTDKQGGLPTRGDELKSTEGIGQVRKKGMDVLLMGSLSSVTAKHLEWSQCNSAE